MVIFPKDLRVESRFLRRLPGTVRLDTPFNKIFIVYQNS